jgi:hypothetical protein
MTEHSLTAGQLSGNSNKQDKQNKQNEIDSQISSDSSSNENTTTYYLSFSSAQEIIRQLLTYERIVLQPCVMPKLTNFELAKKLNISVKLLKNLQASPLFYKAISGYISFPLAKLYCGTLLYKSFSVRNGSAT